MRPSHRTVRLKLAWLLGIPFFWLARPTPGLLLLGLSIAVPGLILRAVAAGHIEKDRTLATTGPYAALRHPLYLGSFLVGVGLAVAGGRWALFFLLLPVLALVYSRTIAAEEEELTRLFGEEYRAYRARVSAFVPSLRPGEPGGFSLRLFLRNREWEAPLGVLAGFLLLWLKLVWVTS